MEDIHEDFFEELIKSLDLMKSELGYNNAPKRSNVGQKVNPIAPLEAPGSQDILQEANSIKSQKDPVAIAKNIKDKKARKKALREIRRGNKTDRKDIKSE